MLFDKLNQNNSSYKPAVDKCCGYKTEFCQQRHFSCRDMSLYSSKKQSYMNSMVNITYVQTEFAESITNLEYSQIDVRFGNELRLLRSLSGRVLSI